MAHHGPLILGSTGRVGRALAQTVPAGQGALWQHRPGHAAPAAPAYTWDILTTEAPVLPAGVTGIVHLARGADTATEIALARAACDLGERDGLPVLVASSQAVYGAPVGGVADEDTPCVPVSGYGRTKLAVEEAVAGRATCLRIGNVIGCDMLLTNAARGPVALDRLADGASPARSYIGAGDLWAVFTALLAHPAPPSIVNVARPGTVAMADLLAAAGLRWTWQTAGPEALPRLELDVHRLTEIVPLSAATPASLIAAARAGGWRPAP